VIDFSPNGNAVLTGSEASAFVSRELGAVVRKEKIWSGKRPANAESHAVRLNWFSNSQTQKDLNPGSSLFHQQPKWISRLPAQGGSNRNRRRRRDLPRGDYLARTRDSLRSRVRNATSVLRDGDEVEVDSDAGTVIIL